MKIAFQLKNYDWYTIYYNEFSVGSADNNYPLTVGGFNEEDDDVIAWFASHQLNGMKFSTPDTGVRIITWPVVTVQLNWRVDGGTITVLILKHQHKSTLHRQPLCDLH